MVMVSIACEQYIREYENLQVEPIHASVACYPLSFAFLCSASVLALATFAGVLFVS